MKGRKPTPTHLRLLRGNPGKRAINRDEPQPHEVTDVPEAPPFLTEYARQEWQRIASELRYLHLLTLVDLNPLAAYFMAYSRWRTAEEALAEMTKDDPKWRGFIVYGAQGTPVKNPLVTAVAKAAADMVRYASEFGFTPAARCRISSGPAGDKHANKFAGLLGG